MQARNENANETKIDTKNREATRQLIRRSVTPEWLHTREKSNKKHFEVYFQVVRLIGMVVLVLVVATIVSTFAADAAAAAAVSSTSITATCAKRVVLNPSQLRIIAMYYVLLAHCRFFFWCFYYCCCCCVAICNISLVFSLYSFYDVYICNLFVVVTCFRFCWF